MAAIDPTSESTGPSDAPLRATLKVFRQPLLDELEDDYDSEDNEDDDEFDADEMDRILAGEDSESSDDDEDVNGGPSDPAKSKKARKEQARKDIKKLLEAEGMDVDGEDMPNGVNGTSKSDKALGKLPASDEEDDSEIESDEEGEIEEFVICTLDANQHYQQPLDITIGEDERVWFKVTGTHSVYLTGNYVEPADNRPGMFDPDSDDEEDYDMEPDEDELDDSMDEGESADELDDMEDPRITEVASDDEEAPQLAKVAKKKVEQKPTANKNKRPAEDEVEGGAETLDDMITKEKAAADGVNGEQKLSKKQLKKLKKNDGQAGAAPAVEKAEKTEAEAPSSNGKKVQFAKELEQGPTPPKDAKSEKKDDKSKPALGIKTVQGVTIDDKKLGTGQAAKNGDRISMRYIGKLKDTQKVFDSNKKGKPFSFKLGAGEVIKGWEIGVQGIQAGGERRITIPAHHAYGSKKLPDIPANSALVFDIKALEVGKSGGK